ncbi:MAG: hydroxyphenylacetyl-CoA thioesterase PaaI [Acetobacteraceae bacterium]|nr:hydroxyphenylacetyl-CoA thioesterase PaaI [Acetobacteraceae bacterium]
MNDPDSLAWRCAGAMWADDAASQGLGMVLEHVAPGQSRMTMPVRADMLNGLGFCHGGFIFAWADSTMAFAANAHGDKAVAQHIAITYLWPGKRGETLTAEATERSRVGRSGIYDVRVTGSPDGSAVSEFRGHTRLSRGRFFTEDA